jgi:hypothetical protein
LQAVVGGAGEQAPMVLETSRGFYPIETPVALARGVALVRQTRRNGRRFICDAGGLHCVGSDGQGIGFEQEALGLPEEQERQGGVQ